MGFCSASLFNLKNHRLNKPFDIFIVYLISFTYICESIKRTIMNKENSKSEPFRLFDREKKLYVRIKLNETTKHWERWISKTKNKWEMTHSSLSLADVMKFQEEIVESNYRNFYKMFFKK